MNGGYCFINFLAIILECRLMLMSIQATDEVNEITSAEPPVSRLISVWSELVHLVKKPIIIIWVPWQTTESCTILNFWSKTFWFHFEWHSINKKSCPFIYLPKEWMLLDLLIRIVQICSTKKPKRWDMLVISKDHGCFVQKDETWMLVFL